MAEIINFQKALATRAKQECDSTKLTESPPLESVTVKRSSNPASELARMIYEMGIDGDSPELIGLGANMLVRTLGAHKAGVTADNIKRVHRFHTRQKPQEPSEE